MSIFLVIDNIDYYDCDKKAYFISCPNASTFLDFGYILYFLCLARLFKFQHKKNLALNVKHIQSKEILTHSNTKCSFVKTLLTTHILSSICHNERYHETRTSADHQCLLTSLAKPNATII